MDNEFQKMPPFLFNPLKHHLGMIKEFISSNHSLSIGLPGDPEVKIIKHLGGSVMDVYTGKLSLDEILTETDSFLKEKKIKEITDFKEWSGKDFTDFRRIELSDESQWILKYFDNEINYIHIFPARYSPHSFRVKANTLKSAILYILCIGKYPVTEEDLNQARALAGLSPVKDMVDSEAINEMIMILTQ
ncbi:MAG: hypothetical protein C0408_02645 [Odoribacter sp.]|nr:hypothetical protein [Odoribacter sp.]